jgi:branched-subunit amino acid aminotransferase/4-amino-4-deoxychorismate lyase
MLATQGRIFRIERHMARIDRSARELGLTEKLHTSALAEAAETAVEQSELAVGDRRARVRLTITGGDLNMLAGAGRGPSDPTILISVTPATEYPPALVERGIHVLLAQPKTNPFDPTAGHKTLNYWWRLRVLQTAGAQGASEALVLQVTNHISGGCVSNLFAVKDGTLITPIAHGEEVQGAIPSPVLPGVTRSAILEFAGAMKLPIDRRMMTIADVLDADEVFLTNSSWGVLPVVKVEAKEIGNGVPGGTTKELREAWLMAVRDEP